MAFKILTKNGVDNTNIDGARAHNFNAGRRSGIVKGALNSGNFFASSNNTIALDTCELRLCGHRIVLDEVFYKTFTGTPNSPIRYSLVARVIVDDNDNVSFEFIVQEATTQLVQDNLDVTGSGTYELEIGKFTQLTDGNITDIVRTADLITGGADNDSDYIRIGTVTTNKISPELDADVDIENTINPDDNKPQTNFTFNLPTAVGTVVSLNGEEQTSMNTDLVPTANSTNLVTSGGVAQQLTLVRSSLTDVINTQDNTKPAVSFAESERQKSKNLLQVKNGLDITSGGGLKVIIGKDNVVTVRGDITGNTAVTIINNRVKVKKGEAYTLSFYDFSNLSDFAIATTAYKNNTETLYDTLNLTPEITTITKTFDDDYELNIQVYATTNQSPSGSFKLMLEQADTKSDEYQSYNGIISHTGDKEIEFARAEYEKTKNLWNSPLIYKNLSTTAKVSYDVDTDTFSYTRDTELSGTQFLTMVYGELPAGIYTISCNVTNIDNIRAPLIFAELNTSNVFVKSISTILITADGKYTAKIVLSETTRVGLLWYYNAEFYSTTTPAGTKTLSNIQLEKGAVETEFQSYTGDIVHKKDIEHVYNAETIYDLFAKNSTINWGMTNGIQAKENEAVVTGKDFSKYKYLRFLFRFSDQHIVWELPLRDAKTINTPSLGVGYITTAIAMSHDEISDMHYAQVFVNNALSSLYFSNVGYVSDGTVNTRYEDPYWIILKIEGVY